MGNSLEKGGNYCPFTDGPIQKYSETYLNLTLNKMKSCVSQILVPL
jgi:hypothetical protein